jgi:hypothetical protein
MHLGQKVASINGDILRSYFLVTSIKLRKKILLDNYKTIMKTFTLDTLIHCEKITLKASQPSFVD